MTIDLNIKIDYSGPKHKEIKIELNIKINKNRPKHK